MRSREVTKSQPSPASQNSLTTSRQGTAGSSSVSSYGYHQQGCFAIFDNARPSTSVCAFSQPEFHPSAKYASCVLSVDSESLATAILLVCAFAGAFRRVVDSWKRRSVGTTRNGKERMAEKDREDKNENVSRHSSWLWYIVFFLPTISGRRVTPMALLLSGPLFTPCSIVPY